LTTTHSPTITNLPPINQSTYQNNN
jgi:hypothetical protein